MISHWFDILALLLAADVLDVDVLLMTCSCVLTITAAEPKYQPKQASCVVDFKEAQMKTVSGASRSMCP